jgi:hypothetical protein
MSNVATEPHSARAVRVSKRRATHGRFYALDGLLCVVIEADSEEDARYLCHDLRFEFIGLCEH